MLIAVRTTASPSAAPLYKILSIRLEKVGSVYTSPISTVRYVHGLCREIVRSNNPSFDWDCAAVYVAIA
ncbi:hypothetical protein MDUV_35610 [Mycolicibacterium duvalii]|uniref:Uncharacterized protein n=1 Tax=Mycolicibacterium duvalii TaxID=39688 RepID=A0A7I7K5D1_9MYCO|nr:hypothetical protein MDUV_35610 [Mycolicibacterium duvalii]